MPPATAAVLDCIAPASCAKSDGLVLAPPTRVRLLGVLKEHGRTFVTFACGAGSRIVECKPGDLRSFAKFRRRVLVELGLHVDHECEDLHRHCDRRDAWQLAVREAVLRGGER